MRLARCLPALAVLLLTTALASPADPQAIVRMERAFAERVRALGVRAGFLDWLAASSVVFRPGPVPGPATYEQQPMGWHGLLAWHPVRAAISGDGSMGWSTGPWTWRRDSTALKSDAFGEYMSVWRRQPDGSWRVALDCGIGHGDPLHEETEVTYSSPASISGLGARPLAARRSLYQADASFARYAASEGVAGAMARYATDDIVVLREGKTRIVGRAAARAALTPFEREATLMSNAQYIAESGDMGYTYGSYVTGRGASADSAWYVHVWHRGAAATWRLACDVLMPVPRK